MFNTLCTSTYNYIISSVHEYNHNFIYLKTVLDCKFNGRMSR